MFFSKQTFKQKQKSTKILQYKQNFINPDNMASTKHILN